MVCSSSSSSTEFTYSQGVLGCAGGSTDAGDVVLLEVPIVVLGCCVAGESIVSCGGSTVMGEMRAIISDCWRIY